MSLPYKLVLLGDSSVGKTSLVHRFTTDTFDSHQANTIGAAFTQKKYTADGKTVSLEIWDTAGQERYKSLTPMYYRNARAALVCFDISAPQDSFERAEYWIEQLKVAGPLDIRVFVVGNKEDISPEADLLRIMEFCRERELPVFLTSAKLGSGVAALFTHIVGTIDQTLFDEYEQRSEEERGLRLQRQTHLLCC